MKIKIIIIDDEPNARQALLSMLLGLPYSFQLLGEADDVASGVALLKKEQPDLLFLDIKLKNKTGFELLQQVPDLNAEVVFVTAYDNYAIKAFQIAALAYLLKPLRMNELETTIARFLARRTQSDDPKRVQILLENQGPGGIQKLVVQDMKGFQVLRLDNIIYLKGENNYSRIVLTNLPPILTSKTLKEYESMLEPYGFFRIHQSHLINLQHVTAYQKGEGGVVSMSNGDHLDVSRRKRLAFVQQFLG
jgi:two-component system LytT family response regulator